MEVGRTNLFVKLKSLTIIKIICIFVICSSAFAIYRRTYLDWIIPDHSVIDSISYVHAVLQCIPFFIIPFMCVGLFLPQSKFVKWVNSLIKYDLFVIICYSGIALCLLMWIIDAPMIIGSWPSDMLLFASFLLFYSLLYKRVPNMLALILCVGIMGVWTGVWELPYQIALKLMYDAPQIGLHETFRWIQWEIIVELPMAGCGLGIVAILGWQFKVIKFNKWFFIFMALYIGFMAYWILDGYWVDTHYNWDLGLWVQTDGFNKLHLFLSKASKVWFLLALISLVWRRNEN